MIFVSNVGYFSMITRHKCLKWSCLWMIVTTQSHKAIESCTSVRCFCAWIKHIRLYFVFLTTHQHVTCNAFFFRIYWHCCLNDQLFPFSFLDASLFLDTRDLRFRKVPVPDLFRPIWNKYWMRENFRVAMSHLRNPDE